MTNFQTTDADMGVEINNAESTWPALHGRLHTAVRILWIGWAIVALGIFVASLPAYLGGMTPHSANPEATGQFAAGQSTLVTQSIDAASAVASITAAIVSLGLATLLFLRKSNDGMAMFVSFLMLTYGIVLAGPLERLGLIWEPARDLATPAQSILLATPILLLACLFPSGRFVPRWTRWIVPASLLWILVVFLVPPLDTFSALSPVAITGIVLLALMLPLVGIYAQVYRYRNVSTLEEKQQTKWVVYGLGLWFVWIVISSVPYMILLNQPAGTPVSLTFRVMGLMWWMAMSIVPVSLTISVMRFRLWDIDLVVNRTLVYGFLTAIVIGIYVLIVGGLGAIFQAQGNLLVALFATGLIAVLFQPLRARVQQWVNRLVYGERDDPVAALSSLGKRLEGTLAAEDVLPSIVESVAESLKLPYAAIGLEGNTGYQIVAEYGKPTEEIVEFPLVYQSENIGRLVVAPRSPKEPFNPADMTLLRNIASQAGVAVHGVQLTLDLRRSQQQLVTTREEERRRLRRDIHDGLGPSLAAYMLTIGSARSALPENTELADRLLANLEEDLESTLNEIRRLVYNLRPPELDQLGLVGALRRYAAQYSNGSGPEEQGLADDLVINIHAKDPVPSMPAAVEAAAYRITQEAVNNVVRHAQAHTCDISLDFSDSLSLSIRDDGVGMPQTVKAGIGLASMQERALELGGSCKIISNSGKGTKIEVELPLSNSTELILNPVTKN
jgi:signal transduction histidine kinase